MHMRFELGMSWVDAQDTIEEGAVQPAEVLEALRVLDRAGELEHLFTLVFVGGMKLKREATEEAKDDLHALILILGHAPTSTSSWFNWQTSLFRDFGWQAEPDSNADRIYFT